MTTPKQYAAIDDWVYEVNKAKGEKSRFVQAGGIIYENHNQTGQRYKVLKTDNNEFENREIDGFQAMAVAPIVNSMPDKTKIIIAFAGTNKENEQEITADLQNVIAKAEQPTDPKAAQFESARKFYRAVATSYGEINIASVTGHSFGGALAQKVAAENKIPAVTFSSVGVGGQLTEEEKVWINGEGRNLVINYMHFDDQISALTHTKNYGTSVMVGDFGNDLPFSGHFLISYHFNEAGDLLKKDGSPVASLSNGVEAREDYRKFVAPKIKDLKQHLAKEEGNKAPQIVHQIPFQT